MNFSRAIVFAVGLNLVIGLFLFGTNAGDIARKVASMNETSTQQVALK